MEKIVENYIEYFKMRKDIEEFHELAERYGFLSPRLVAKKEREQKMLRKVFLGRDD
jgi:hypothetical protein